MAFKNSLNTYREKTIQDQNPTKPAKINQSKDYAGSSNRNQTISTGTIFGSSAPTYPNFSTYYTTDSILNGLGNYTSTTNDTSAAEIVSYTIGGLTILGSLAMGITQMVNAFGGGK